MVNARSLAVSANDDVAMIDRDAKAIVVADRDGKVVSKLAPKGTGYELSDPADVAFDALGHLYVLDADRPSIYVFRPGGSLATTLLTIASDPTSIQRPRALAVDAAGRLYVYDERLQRIQIYQ
jgi:hypothetical protein